jgi:hypothetical protein
MSHEKKAAFKMGFLLCLAEKGITPDAFFKRAADGSQFLSGIGDVTRNVGGHAVDAGKWGLGSAVSALTQAPIVAGSALGSAHAAMEAPSESGIQALRRVEELETLNRLTREIHARRARHQE